MKLIEAYVRSVMFDHVVQALMHIHIQGLSFVEMRGIGHAATDPETHWGGEFEHVHKIEIICHDDQVEPGLGHPGVFAELAGETTQAV